MSMTILWYPEVFKRPIYEDILFICLFDDVILTQVDRNVVRRGPCLMCNSLALSQVNHTFFLFYFFVQLF